MAGLEATALATSLRNSVWVYPLVNAAHILGVALLVGAIAPLDLRLIGFWPSVPLITLWYILSRTAAVGLAIAISAGALLFITRAGDYAESKIFLFKLLVILAGFANIGLLRHWMRNAGLGSNPSAAMRLAGVLSLVIWIKVLVLGRLVGYF